VRETIEHSCARVDQALKITCGTRDEVHRCAVSVRKQLETNPSISAGHISTESPPRNTEGAAWLSPANKAAERATEQRTLEYEAQKTLRVRLGRVPYPDELNDEVAKLRLVKRREQKRQKQVNTPVVEALVELEELCCEGVELLDGHITKLYDVQSQLLEVYEALGAHYNARDAVVATKNRMRVARLEDEPTHEVLSIAAEREDLARVVCNQAVKAARQERSTMAANKAEVQLAVRMRGEMVEQHRRMDKQGCTFKGWSREELKLH
jgi:hypothetical protein